MCIINPGVFEYNINENIMYRYEVKLYFKMEDWIFYLNLSFVTTA